jgi:hypothetical protein
MAKYIGRNPPGLRVCRVSNPPLRERKDPFGGREMFGDREKQTRQTRKPATRAYRPALTFTS